MNNIDILEEKENIKLEDKYKQTLKMAKEVMEDVSERNNGCEPSKSECLAYNMQYVKKYVETLIAENKELKEENKKLTDEYMIQKHLINAEFLDDYIPKSKVEEAKKKYEWSIEHYDCDEADYRQSQAIGAWNALQSLLGKE